MSKQENFETELLIGADHYWDVIEDTIVRGNDPTAGASKIGHLLSNRAVLISITVITSKIAKLHVT